MATIRSRNRWVGGLAALAAAVLLVPGCNPVENASQSATLLRIVSLTGKDLANQDVNFLLSDVLYVSPETGAQSWIADTAKATFSAELYDPKSISGSSLYNDVLLTRYVVTFQRADGKSAQGVDVPYSFEGAMSVQVPIGQATSASFIIVREVAKQEPPLLNLKDGLAGDGLYVTAKVDFYGHDGANKMVKATGYLPVTFANYGN
jgi:hypothetical protein